MRTLADLLASPPDLPVVAGLDDIARVQSNVVISAPPGSGKTTMAPVLMATLVSGKVIVVQPRRVAARAAARRIVSLLGQDLGVDVGFRVRGSSSPGERIEMVTPGVLLRMLQTDPELDGVDCVIVDEVHERDLDTDLALAFLLDVQEALRPDLRLVAMSATIALEKTAGLMDADVVEVSGDIHPVETVEVLGPQALTAVATGAIEVNRDYLDHVADVVRQARRDNAGSILVFVPGAREIDELRSRLSGLGVPVLPLHGKLSVTEQDRALDAGEDRVIISTAIAESSLTVPGVRVVVDACLSREPRVDPVTGIGGLITVHAHRASMTQRAGRAGRLGPGVAYRCLSFGRATEFGEPEIRTADLTGALLQTAAWGAARMKGLKLLDDPREGAVVAGIRELAALGLTDADGAITDLGRTAATFPTSPRTARALISGAERVGADRAADVVAFLESGSTAPGADLVVGLRAAKRAGGEFASQAKRLRSMATKQAEAHADPGARQEVVNLDDAAATVVGLARPGWLARKRGGGYLLANGTGAVLPAGSPLTGEEWLAIGDLGRAQGRSEAMIYSAVPIDQMTARELGEHLMNERVDVTAEGSKVTGRRVRSLGAIELTSEPVKNFSPQDIIDARMGQIRSRGLDSLPWTDASKALRERLAFVRSAVGDPWPDVSDTGLLDSLDIWLAPQLASKKIDVATGLRNLLPWPEAARFDELAPERIETPLGSAKVDYSHERPRVRMKLQEAFGWTKTPEFAGVPVTLELLSPAQRPLAVTDDLASFWAGPYAGVRADMRGRYPKHPWPEDPLAAEPTSRTNRRRT